jgi:hypothetical protein
MKKVILSIVFVLMICTTSFSSSAITAKNDKSNIIQNDLNKYYQFLSGELIATDSDKNIVNINDIFSLDENYNKYTFFDSNNDGIPELQLSSMEEYDIIECINDKLVIIYTGTGYDKLLNNGALLSTRNGGAPEHISYIYTKLGTNNKIDQIEFEKYNTSNNNPKDDLYLFEGKKVSKNEFNKKTNGYLNINSDLIIWSDYWTFLAEKNMKTDTVQKH